MRIHAKLMRGFFVRDCVTSFAQKTGLFDFRKDPFHDCPNLHGAGKNDLFSSQCHVFSCLMQGALLCLHFLK